MPNKMPAGRPTEYGPRIIKQAQEYLKKYREFDEVIPTIEGLSVYLGIRRSTIYDWASQEDKKEFSDILESILSMQGKTLVAKGLSGDFNSTITKLMLSKHGYRESQEIDHTTKGEKIAGFNYITPEKPEE
ncbi:MAG: terminase small subunit [Blastocatellia bacterium]